MTVTGQAMLSVTQLHKQYGETTAVGGISFQVGRNEIVGLLGLFFSRIYRQAVRTGLIARYSAESVS